MNSHLALVYPCGEPPSAGEVRQVAPGVWWIRMPMPETYSLSHINLWAIEEEGGVAIIDTGVHADETVAAWNTIFSTAFQGRAVTRVLVTHMHPDHVGMAGWLTRTFACRLWMTRLEYLMCRTLAADTGRAAPEDGIRFYRQAGWREDAIENYRARFGGFGASISTLPDSFRRLQDGEQLIIGRYEWQVITGTGHSPGHACLYCPELNVLISGDQVLPRISSNVSVFPVEPDANPLGDWMNSLQKFKDMVPGDALVLPAHNEPFFGLHERLAHLAQGHETALTRLRAELESPKRAVDVFGALFSRRIEPENYRKLGLATGESIAHLNYLIQRGEAYAETGADGALWYRLKE